MYVDVRDVARAHVLAAEVPQAEGRYILSHTHESDVTEIAGWLQVGASARRVANTAAGRPALLRLMPPGCLWSFARCFGCMQSCCYRLRAALYTNKNWQGRVVVVVLRREGN